MTPLENENLKNESLIRIRLFVCGRCYHFKFFSGVASLKLEKESDTVKVS